MKENKFKGDDYEFSPRKRNTKKKAPKAEKSKTEKRVMKIVAIIASVIIALSGILFVLGYSMVDTHTVSDGVYVGNISLGGLSLDQAKQSLEGLSFDEPYEIKLLCNDKTYTITTEGLDYTINTEKTAEKAFNYGKSGNMFSKIIAAFSAKHNKIDVLPVFEFDSTQIAEKLNEIGYQAIGTMTEHTVTIENNQIIVTPGTLGYNNDPTDALSTFEFALENQCENEIKITFNSVAPQIMTIDRLYEFVSADGLDAAFEIKDGEVEIIEGRSGYTFDEQEATEALTKLRVGGEPVTINCTPVAPKLSSEELRAKLFNKELASYSTRYNAGQTNRSKNVAVAAGKLNGVIILPGDTLSFNATVGKRTTANGFMPAPEYQNGRSVTGIGGGTCQVSTTLYSAALYANLEIVSRRNHSMSVSYVPLGQDATVTDSGTDLKIRNNTKFPIKLVTSAGGGTITVKIVGTAPEPPVTVKIVNTTTGPLSATTTRILYDASGNEISREVVATSKYKPHGSGDSSSENTSSNEPAPEPTPTPQDTPTAPEGSDDTQPPQTTSAPSSETTPKPTTAPSSKPSSPQTPVVSEPPKAPETPKVPETPKTLEKTPAPVTQKSDSAE